MVGPVVGTITTESCIKRHERIHGASSRATCDKECATYHTKAPRGGTTRAHLGGALALGQCKNEKAYERDCMQRTYLGTGNVPGTVHVPCLCLRLLRSGDGMAADDAG